MKRRTCMTFILLFIFWTSNYFIPLTLFAQVTQEWVRTYDGGVAKSMDNALAIKADRQGNIYVTGRTQVGIRFRVFPNYDITTIKYNTHGDQLWVSNMDLDSGENRPNDLAIDKHGNVYVTGYETNDYGCGQNNGITVKYNPNGVQQWVQRFKYDSVPCYSGVSTSSNAIVVDDFDNVYITGSIYKPDQSSVYPSDYVTIKYNTSGVQQWLKRYSVPNSKLAFGESIAIDKSGNVYVFGLSGSANVYLLFRYDLVKYNSEGVQLWSWNYEASGGLYTIRKNTLVVDDSSNAYIIGAATGGLINVVKLDTDGNVKWTQKNIQGFPQSIALDKTANVFVTGWTGNLDQKKSDFITIKYNTEGEQQWVQQYNGPEKYRDEAHNIVIDTAENAYVAGWSFSRRGVPDYLTIKYNSDGEPQWIERYNGPENGPDQLSSLALDRHSNVFVTGTSNNNFTTIKYAQSPPAQNGLCCFTKSDELMAVCGPNITAVNCERSGKNAFFVGSVNDCTNIDTSTICSRTTIPVSLTVNFNEADNTVLLSWQLSTDHKTTGYYIQRSKDGENFKTIGFMPINTSGNYSFTDNYPLLEGYYKLVWFEQHGFESNKALAVAVSSTKMQLVPNPANDKIRILIRDMQNYITTVSVYDNTGRLILTQKLNKNQSPEMNISMLASGTYYTRAEMNGKVYNEKLLKK